MNAFDVISNYFAQQTQANRDDALTRQQIALGNLQHARALEESIAAENRRAKTNEQYLRLQMDLADENASREAARKAQAEKDRLGEVARIEGEQHKRDRSEKKTDEDEASEDAANQIVGINRRREKVAKGLRDSILKADPLVKDSSVIEQTLNDPTVIGTLSRAQINDIRATARSKGFDAAAEKLFAAARSSDGWFGDDKSRAVISSFNNAIGAQQERVGAAQKVDMASAIDELSALGRRASELSGRVKSKHQYLVMPDEGEKPDAQPAPSSAPKRSAFADAVAGALQAPAGRGTVAESASRYGRGFGVMAPGSAAVPSQVSTQSPGAPEVVDAVDYRQSQPIGTWASNSMWSGGPQAAVNMAGGDKWQPEREFIEMLRRGGASTAGAIDRTGEVMFGPATERSNADWVNNLRYIFGISNQR